MAETPRFSRRTYAAPFGRYVAGSEAEPPANEVLIGREGQRAYFIELLLRAGKRGAYLVTGNRGVGKTSFVRYCLKEYEDEIFERFLRSDVGRALFWDRLIIAAFGVVALCMALMVSELLEILLLAATRSKSGSGNTPSLFVWPLIAPAVITCLYPMLYAWEVISEIFRNSPREFLRRAPSISSAILTFGLAMIIFWAPPFGGPSISVSYLFYIFSGIYLLRTIRPIAGPLKNYFIDVICVAILLVAPPLWNHESPSGLLLVLLGSGLMFVASATMIVGYIAYHEPSKISRKIWLSYTLVSLGTAIPAGVLLCASSSTGQEVRIFASIFILLSCAHFIVKFRENHGRDIAVNSYKPQIALLLKAFFSIAISLQLLHPLLAVLRPSAESQQVIGIIRSAISLAEVPGRRVIPDQVESPSAPGRQNDIGLMDAANEERSWIVAVALVILLLYSLDYEWVIRPMLPIRSDPTIRKNHPNSPQDRARGRRIRARRLARVTLPWILYRAWLPMITISVNLGFEKLDHRRIIQAMLVALQDRYRRLFLAWNSVLANLTRALGLLLLLAGVGLIGGRWFKLPDQNTSAFQDDLAVAKSNNYSYPCDLFHDSQNGPGVVNLICAPIWGNHLFHSLYFNLTDSELWAQYPNLEKHLLLQILPYQKVPWPDADQPFLKRGLSIRVYHLLIFFFLFIISRLVLRRVPLLPYRDIQRRIDSVLDNLTASTSVTSRTGRWQPAQWLEGFLIGERVRQINQEPFDPRSVEFLFLHVLDAIQEATIRLPGARNQRMSLPVPEITFVFDELDKLGTRVEPSDELSAEPQQTEILNAERRRSLELHKLLADMKNLLASAPARFIFVGGRNLHDEWLADQTSRLPLLTNIFSAEVYLPSLLTDRSGRDTLTTLDENVGLFLQASIQRAELIYEASSSRRRLPSFGLVLDEREPDVFVEPLSLTRPPVPGQYLPHLKLSSLDSEETLIGSSEFGRDFIAFLAYRSMGNPKRLRELLGSFARPVWRVVTDQSVRTEKFSCDHVLVFEDEDRFRIQLIARVYRHLLNTFDRGFTRRDDKMTVSVFFLSDFLFKFHRRAFSWANLERVEDMFHIHRAPDLREVMGTMVEQWSERFLHPIRNGMYDFRFRSEIAREVDYISRHSPAEMAAFNFTLDESQTLKSLYEGALRRLKEGTSKELQDLVAGMGELHEFDQEYETARLYYRQSVSHLDRELRAITGGSELLETQSPMLQIIGGISPGPENARNYITWGVARLRLMLQIGMTYELARNFERAGVEYGNASTLSRSLILALLEDQGRARAFEENLAGTFEETHQDRLHALKHLNILFQPVFAEAWAAEKMAGALDTSLTLIERDLRELRCILPFISSPRTEVAANPTEVGHSNFALIAADLHGKAGDLLFFKGRNLVTERRAEEWSLRFNEKIPRHRTEGYLLRSHYHYAVALHELRRFTAYRKASSKKKLNVWGDISWETIEPGAGAWPDYVLRSLGGTLNDFAEVMLGRVSRFGLLQCLCFKQLERSAETGEGRHSANLVETFTKWMESLSDCTSAEDRAKLPHIRIPLGSHLLDAGTLNGWLGIWNEGWSSQDAKRDLIIFPDEEREKHDDLSRVCVSLGLMLVGAHYLEKAGYVEDAARELVKVADAASSYLSWLHMVKSLANWNRRQDESARIRILEVDRALLSQQVLNHGFWTYLRNIALYSLERASFLYLRGRRAEGESEAYLVGHRIPVFALVGACSLGLVMEPPTFDPSKPSNQCRDEIARLQVLVRSWTGPSDLDWRELLEQCIERHCYPMLARLQALKALVDKRIVSLVPLKAANRTKTTPTLLELALELVDLAESYNSPLHFTPAQLGTSVALAFLFGKPDTEVGPKEAAKWERLRQVAQRELLRSEEMYNLRRSFYESISDLYYLFDDFNDRQIHYGHAMQMASSEHVSLLRRLIMKEEIDKIGRTRLAYTEYS